MEEVPTLLCHGKFGQVFEQCRFSVSLSSVWLSNGYSYLAIWKRFFCLFLISSLSHCYFALDIMQSTGWFTHERKWLNFSEVLYVDIGKAVWIFEVSSNMEADSTEQLDSQKHESLWHGFASWYFSFVVLWTCVLSLAEFQWLQC